MHYHKLKPHPTGTKDNKLANKASSTGVSSGIIALNLAKPWKIFMHVYRFFVSQEGDQNVLVVVRAVGDQTVEWSEIQAYSTVLSVI